MSLDIPIGAPLTSGERARLAACEAVIAQGLRTFIEVGSALLEIRDNRLYGESHATFEDYCRQRWGMDKRYANRLIDASEISKVLGSMDPKTLESPGTSTMVDKTMVDIPLPENERQARPLAALRDDPQAQRAAWQAVVDLSVETGVPITAAMVKEAVAQKIAGDRRKEAIQEIKESFARLPKAEGGSATLYHTEAVRFLRAIPPGSVDMLLTDPPYSTDVEDVQAFAASWLPLALSRLKPAGRAYVCIGAYPDELLAYLTTERAGFGLEQILVWTYRNTLGPSPSHTYSLNWQAVLYFMGPHADPLNCPVMMEQFAVQDITAPDGRQGNRYHSWQKPDELAERFIRHASAPGDIVLDPFACTGTFVAAAGRLGRRGIGCDIDAVAMQIASARGVSVRPFAGGVTL